MAEQISNTTVITASIAPIFKINPNWMAQMARFEASWVEKDIQIEFIGVEEFSERGSNIVIQLKTAPTYLALYRYIHSLFGQYFDYEPLLETSEVTRDELYDHVQSYLEKAVNEGRWG